MQNNKFRIGIINGGPSLERGISLNSSRSIADHLSNDSIEIVPIYFDPKKHAYLLSRGHLYSNTPSDFDFQVSEIAKDLSPRQLELELKRCNLVFPAVHGQFGEDGELQSYLEKIGVPFVGSSSEACKRCFDKFNANEFIREKGFFAPTSLVLKIYKSDHKEKIQEFFTKYNIQRAVVKPATGGSSIGVFSVATPEEALEKVETLFSKRLDTRVVIEPFAQGREFTVIILQNRFGLPVAIIPTEIEADYTQHQIFDYRKKYLPTRQVTFHCPPRFSDSVIERIQVEAEQLFTAFGMSDFARFDGWVLDSGEIWFSDFNPISGMEQNSFLFQQASRVGLSHRSLLHYVIRNACSRHDINPPLLPLQNDTKKTKVSVLFGGSTSERQVSLMSGTNVWLKLRSSQKYIPEPYLLDSDGSAWNVPYALLLNHTVEEVAERCSSAEVDAARLNKFESSARLRLALEDGFQIEKNFIPKKISLNELVEQSDFLFLALHGGIGEDGTLQELCENSGTPFNGCGSAASKVCMDKFETGKALSHLEAEGIICAPKHSIKTTDFLESSMRDLETLWKNLEKTFRVSTMIIKPQSDGCSSGIVKLRSAAELRIYFEYLKSGATRIPPDRFEGQVDPVEMPSTLPEAFILEPFIETDKIRVVGGELKITPHTGWVEVTVGVLEHNGKIHSLNPSITIADGEVLSLEEKFQGGTGVNLTPPPAEIISTAVCKKIKSRIEKVAQTLQIEGYSRIDAFVNRVNGKVMIIEVNTLPGLTPSTVLYHQGISESPSMMPPELLERIINAGLFRCAAKAESLKSAVA